MCFILPKEICEDLKNLREMNDDIKNRLDYLKEKTNKQDLQHQVLLISLARVVKYFDAYLGLAEKGFGEPAACMLRSIYEASLWMRWSLEKHENAEVYFNSSKAEAIRMVGKIVSKGLAQLKNAPDPELVKQLLKTEVKKYKLPSWDKLAKETGLDDFHTLVYPMLSAMSHGTMMFLGERLEKLEVSPYPDEINIKPFINIASILLIDCHGVCEDWIINGQLHPVPDYRKLMTMP